MAGHSKVAAAQYRTWQFLEPLLDDGHVICLCAGNLGGDDFQPRVPPQWAGQLEYHPIPFLRKPGWVRRLQHVHDGFEPDCILAVDFGMCLCATRLHTSKPIWMDIYGDYLTIIQAARYRAGSDRGIPTSIAFTREVLKTGDVFSVCGTPQKHALIGELAMAGRLTRHTFFYPFAHVILPGARPANAQTAKRGERPLLSAKGVPDDAFVVLWCGGYNTWTDVDTLFEGLEWAMARDRNVQFVSVGASTYEAPDSVYKRFLRKIKSSQHCDRFHMMGWRPWTEVSTYYRESDVGLNIDALHYETIYGTRTRLVEMIGHALPVITSLGCELADLLEEWGAGLTFEPGDAQGLGRQVMALVTDGNLCRKMARAASNCAETECSFATTTIPVKAWVRKPQRAPDKRSVDLGERFRQREYQARALARRIVWRISGLER